MPTTPRVTAIIQARMASTRLPGKAMLPLAGKPLVHHVIDRILSIPSVHTVVVAVPEGDANLPLKKIAQDLGARAFAGSEEDVLDRFYRAAGEFGGDVIVRVTADNPFTDTGFADIAVKKALEQHADICAPQGLPLGTSVEVISRAALDAAFREGALPHHREHVSPFIKEHPERFSIVRFDSGLEARFRELRLTVDTREDFALAELLYRELFRGKQFPLSEVLDYIDAHPGLADINRHVEQRPMTHSSNLDGDK